MKQKLFHIFESFFDLEPSYFPISDTSKCNTSLHFFLTQWINGYSR